MRRRRSTRPAWPILWSLAATETPSSRAGTMNTPMPLPGGAAGSVRANTMKMSAAGALVMYRLRPSMTQPPSGPGHPAQRR